MQLKQLISKCSFIKVIGNKNKDILALYDKHLEVKKGGLFFCISGTKTNGHNYACNAVANGAVCLVAEQELALPVTQIIVKNTRIAMAEIAKAFYGAACDEMKIITITGTNGKTSCTYLTAGILNAAGIKTAVIGTNGTTAGTLQINTSLTTPDPIELHYVFSQLKNLGVQAVVMEASAHAIQLNKLVGICSEAAVLTNVTPEHLDFFCTMENYTQVKTSWFNKNVKTAVINSDDATGRKLLQESTLPVLSYGIYNPADTFAMDIKESLFGMQFVVNASDVIFEIETHLAGEYNVSNILASINAAMLLGAKTEDVIEGIKSVKNIPGRFNVYNLGCNNAAVIDYAHTPDGFVKILQTVKQFSKGKMIVVFGCVGYSLPKKRAEMGAAAARFATDIVLTTDNPNFVEFDTICSDIKKGIQNVPCVCISNRKEAIAFACKKVSHNDTLVILGKGNETHNLINGVKEPMNDEETLFKCLNISEAKTK